LELISVASLLFDAGAEISWRRADCLSRWPTATIVLEATGLLPTIGAAKDAPCRACGDMHEVEHDGAPVLCCPLAGKLAVSSDDLALVKFDQKRWLEQVGAALELAAPETVIGDFVWRFGRAHASGWRKQIWIARGLDAPDVFDSVAREMRSAGKRGKWLLTSSTPPREAGRALGAEIIRFVDCAEMLGNGALRIDIEALVGPRKGIKKKDGPGRKSKVGPALPLFRKRLAAGEVLPTLVAEAKAIHSALALQIKPEELPSPRTIEDAIRSDYAKAVGRPRPVKP
jgi:hypothetical protein